MMLAMRQRGFSLVELMVAVAILALLIVAAMPSLGTWLENTRIRNEGDSLVNGLQTARAEAVRRNQNVSFWLVHLPDPAKLDNTCTQSTTGTDGSWVVSVSNPGSHCGDDPLSTTSNTSGIVVGRAMGSDSAHVSVTALQSGGTAGSSVTFNGFGRVAGTGSIAEIDLDGTGGSTYRKLNVMVSTTGAVRMCDPLVTSSTDPRKC